LRPASAPKRVPAEFIGLARQFRRQVLAADLVVDRALALIARQLGYLTGRRRGFRPGYVPDLGATWTRLVPAGFSFDREVKRDRGGVMVSELRITGSRWRNDSWRVGADDWEDCVSLTVLAVSTYSGKVKVVIRPLAAVSLHALARRYQRGAGRADADIVHDLHVIADWQDCADSVAAGTGRWFGGAVPTRDDNQRQAIEVLAVRTFIAADQLQYQSISDA
jgi:hypothetical protein